MQEEMKSFQESLWKDLPVIRRSLAGRERVNDLIAVAIEQAPVDLLRHVAGNTTSQGIVMAAWGQNVKRGYCLMRESTDEKQFGPIFWIVIGPLLQILLQKIIDWYFRSPGNMALLKRWRNDR